MTTPNRIVFEATGQPAKDGEYVLSSGGMLDVDSLGTSSIRHARPAYRRIDAPADSRLLEVAIGIYQRNEVSIALEDELRAKLVARCVVDARALIAACEGASQ